jgi:site-specific recombinase XerD
VIGKAHPIVRRELIALSPLPGLFVSPGGDAAERFVDFFAASIRNRHTRRAYYHVACSFASWTASVGVKDLQLVTPLHVATYIEALTRSHSRPTAKQHLAALRRLFDWLVVARVCDTNPAQVVRGPKYSARRGKSPVLDAEDVRALFGSIDTSTLIGLRDRALIGLMVYSFSRVGAATGMKLKDVIDTGKGMTVRLLEKGGKRRELPAHSVLRRYLADYIRAAGLTDANAPLFRTIKRATLGKRDQRRVAAEGLGASAVHEMLRAYLTTRPMSQADAYRMVRRRAMAAGIRVKLGNHSWRATGITTYLNNGGSLENAQDIAGHASPKTTRLYDRRDEADMRAEITRIRF